MIWDYLSQFWDKLTSSTAGAIEYGIDYFQNIGNAVAGAIGNFFDAIFHSINDFIVYIAWFFHSLFKIFILILAPFHFIIVFVKNFLIYAFQGSNADEIVLELSKQKEILNTIPYWDILSKVIFGSFVVFFTIQLIKFATK